MNSSQKWDGGGGAATESMPQQQEPTDGTLGKQPYGIRIPLRENPAAYHNPWGSKPIASQHTPGTPYGRKMTPEEMTAFQEAFSKLQTG